jgi:hypothetical protein
MEKNEAEQQPKLQTSVKDIEEQAASNRAVKRLQDWLSLIGLWLAGIAAICAIIYTHNDAKDQLNAATGQLQLMHNEQRPWLKIEITPDSLNRRPISQFEQIVHSALLRLHITVSNVGHSPAFNALIHKDVYVAAIASSISIADLVAKQAAICDKETKQETLEKDPGDLIFPGDSLKPQNLEAEYHDPNPVIEMPLTQPPVTVVVMGCVHYWAYPSDHHNNESGKDGAHRTGFMFRLMAKKQTIDKPFINPFTKKLGREEALAHQGSIMIQEDMRGREALYTREIDLNTSYASGDLVLEVISGATID